MPCAQGDEPGCDVLLETLGKHASATWACAWLDYSEIVDASQLWITWLTLSSLLPSAASGARVFSGGIRSGVPSGQHHRRQIPSYIINLSDRKRGRFAPEVDSQVLVGPFGRRRAHSKGVFMQKQGLNSLNYGRVTAEPLALSDIHRTDSHKLIEHRGLQPPKGDVEKRPNACQPHEASCTREPDRVLYGATGSEAPPTLSQR